MKKAFTRIVQKLSLKAYEKNIKREMLDNVLYVVGVLFVAIIVLAVLGSMRCLIAFFLMFCIGMFVNLMLLTQLYMDSDKNPWISLRDMNKMMQPFNRYPAIIQQLEHMYAKGQVSDAEVFDKVKTLKDIWLGEQNISSMDKEGFPFAGSPEVEKTKKALRETIDSIYRSLVSWCMTRSA